MKRRAPIARKAPLKRGSPPKRKKRVSRTPKRPRLKLKAECDRLFSRFIRLRDGGCVLEHDCAGPLQCAHGFSRRYFATRWDPINAWALCSGGHYRYTVRPLEWDEWMRERMGELYEPTRRRALAGKMPDLEATRAELRDLVAKYERMNAACLGKK